MKTLVILLALLTACAIKVATASSRVSPQPFNNVTELFVSLAQKASTVSQQNEKRALDDTCSFATIATGGDAGITALLQECQPFQTLQVCQPSETCTCLDTNNLILGNGYPWIKSYIKDLVETAIPGLPNVDKVIEQAANAFRVKTVPDEDSGKCKADKGSVCTTRPIALNSSLSFQIECVSGVQCSAGNFDLPDGVPSDGLEQLGIGKCSASRLLLVSSFAFLICLLSNLWAQW